MSEPTPGQPPMVHELKVWPNYYHDILWERKRFEIRRGDRNFQIGDTIELREYFLATKTYTGERLCVRITYLDHLDAIGIPGFVAMGIRKV